jgi:hypothetical protein
MEGREKQTTAGRKLTVGLEHRGPATSVAIWGQEENKKKGR